MASESRRDLGATRRGLLYGVGMASVAGLLAACGKSNAAGSPASSMPANGPSGGSEVANPPYSAPPAGGGNGGGAAGALGSVADIPVGGGKIFSSQQVVVTQPTKGDFKAFSAVCTHMGCTVGSISHGDIICPCHHSHFSIKDGHVVQGPATQPLPAKTVSTSGGQISVS